MANIICDGLITAAIDFGTAYSGYAYAFKENLLNDPPLITMNNWKDGRRMSTKAPTSVLFDPDKTFHSFGYSAEEKYAELSEDSYHRNWYYFRRFKMNLHRNEARIEPNKLTIALGPEAAAVHCQRAIAEINRTGTGAQLSISQPGSKFMIVDMGGGTVDVTVLEKMTGSHLRQIHVSTGGAWGGMLVDITFEAFLREAFGGGDMHLGDTILKRFKSEQMEDYIDLWRDFEDRKRDEKIVTGGKLSIRVTSSLLSIIETESGGHGLDYMLLLSTHSGKVTKIGDKIRIDSTTFADFFKSTTQGIVDHIRDLFLIPNLACVDTLILVGGFACSAAIHKSLRDTFPTKKIVVPVEPDVSVLKGAVIYGFYPEAISTRISKHTYGVEVVETINNVSIKDVFFVLIRRGQTIDIGTISKTIINPVGDKQQEGFIQMFATDASYPKLTSDAGCRKLGEIRVFMPDTTGGVNRQVEVRTNFAGTELHVTATDKNSNTTFGTAINFLG